MISLAVNLNGRQGLSGAASIVSDISSRHFERCITRRHHLSSLWKYPQPSSKLLPEDQAEDDSSSTIVVPDTELCRSKCCRHLQTSVISDDDLMNIHISIPFSLFRDYRFSNPQH